MIRIRCQFALAINKYIQGTVISLPLTPAEIGESFVEHILAKCSKKVQLAAG